MATPLPTLAAVITETGISAPSFADILSSLKSSWQLIYGADVYLDPDTQDGQALAIFAKAMADVNDAIVAAYNSRSPSTAMGAGLSSLVKINGISRNVASNSQVALLIGGTVGIAINNGIAADSNGNLWALPSSVVIPPAGSILVTATSVAVGSIAASPGTITKINTPTLGWSTVTNPSAAAAGAPVETDAQLRARQTLSVALPARTVLASIVASVETLDGVTEVRAYENDTGTADSDGLPAHSIALVVNGGDITDIARSIMIKKTPGCFTYGTTTVPVTDNVGITHAISFFLPTGVPIRVAITIRALPGYTSAIGLLIQQAVVDYINNLLIGEDVFISRLYLPAQLNGADAYAQFELQSIQISVAPAAVGTSDVIVPFNGQATCLLANVNLTVV